jgi:hypothetical protein
MKFCRRPCRREHGRVQSAKFSLKEMISRSTIYIENPPEPGEDAEKGTSTPAN